MNGWPARSAASRKTHPKHIHPGRGAFCAPAVFAAGEMRLNGSKGRGAFRSAKKSRPNTNYIFSIENKISFAHSLPAEEEERERSIFLWLSRIRRMRVNQNPDFPGSARHVILTVKGAAENRSLFAVGGPGASERGVKKNHDLIRNLKS